MMAKLQFTLDGNALGEFELNKERMTIGRRPANDIHIDNLAVSGEHAAITTIGNDSFLEDMNSTNGTLVNNKTVKKHVLLHNDVIEFGKYQLLYINLAQIKQAATQGTGFENTVVMRPAKLAVAAAVVNDTTKQEVEVQQNTQLVEEKIEDNPAETVALAQVAHEPDPASAPAPVVAPTQTPLAAENSPQVGRLQVLSGANSGRELTLNKALTTLGKPGAQLAVITKRPHGYFITHVEGENLPLVNGLKIGLQAHALNDHDVIDLAGTKMEFFLA
jgi:pSer/pThr/pTyr-binding forkhead associated (FHA) protein